MEALTIKKIIEDYREYLTDREINDLERIQLSVPYNISADSLKLALFGEEWDFMTYEKSNPWSQEYTNRVNRKRKAFGIKPIDGQGSVSDMSSELFCEEVIKQSKIVK
ncbi:hypothetical protein [Winogradskyella bathintestinalis]|uniref:Uncharacterized protein n=1 Tax=Winogradskyella bathintestinalis TaxID=3035208 RepID=A0ABT7ZRF5_9FLAO|nr:hypothetical protein [Winogradskyella bathintestinalis]MDN3491572.1 hypothetical protein [Winogradskyella bathintestinalis]